MRSGVLVAEITTAAEVIRLATQPYADGHTAYRGHLQGFSQTRQASDALNGHTNFSVANLSIHNNDKERDTGLISGTANISIGDTDQAVSEMVPVFHDAPVAMVSRSDESIEVAVLDGQARGKAKQQRIFDTSGDGFGTLLPEIWGKAYRFPLITLDGDTGRVYGCAGPLVSISSVYVDEVRQTSGFTSYLSGSTARVVFTTKPEGSVFIDAVGLGSTLPGALIKDLMTRVSSVCQGHPLSGADSSITLDSRVDDAIDNLVGKTVTLFRESGTNTARSITAFDPVTRIATISGTWGTNPVPDDIYSIAVNTVAGGFTTPQVDSAGFDQLDTDLPYTFGVVATNGIKAVQLQDTLLEPLLCHVGPRRDGTVQLKRLQQPTGEPVIKITRIIGDIERRQMPIYWHVEARYRKDNTGGHWRSVSAFDAQIKADYPEAETLSIDVPVQQSAGAKAIAQHWLDCFGIPTEIAVMQVDHDLTSLDLMDVVEITDDRYQFKDGKLAIVVSLQDNFDDYDELGVWVPML